MCVLGRMEAVRTSCETPDVTAGAEHMISASSLPRSSSAPHSSRTSGSITATYSCQALSMIQCKTGVGCVLDSAQQVLSCKDNFTPQH